MELSEISVTQKDTGLCVGGWTKYRNPKEGTEPFGYALKLMTNNPGVYLYVCVPKTPRIKKKALELKKRCINSKYGIVEVTFDDFCYSGHREQLVNGLLQTVSYNASASDFHFVEDANE